MHAPGTNGSAAGRASGSREPLSLGGKLGAGVGTAYRVLRGRPGRNRRIFSGVKAGVKSFAKPLKAVLHVLFLQVVGVFFLLISLSLGGAFLHEYRQHQLYGTGRQRMALAGVLGCMFLYFAVTSFLRARRKQ